ncbi:hypothetical protein QN277_026967 [Acacia crassicarpa]|uniref:Uncharacterized protein n=1 Tax=Acacia crassicarpa TaxID=499986 RepID=A0AAE1MHY4_9FABA|nr:hypothetical protein QN277_026967 [Acacia crassicarpa]
MATTYQDTWEEEETICSVLEVKDEKTARHQRYISHIFGEAAIKVHGVDRCYVVLDEITCDFIDWYKAIYKSYEGNINRKQDWWNHVEDHLRRLFRRVIKLISKLHSNHSHGNLMGGIAVSEGEAKFFNMKLPGSEGYKNDIDGLLHIITNIVDRVDPDLFFEGLDDDFKKIIGKLHCSKEFTIFLRVFGNSKA